VGAFETVVIDAGHGGKDPGCGWNGLVEKRLCLDVAQRLNEALKAKGLKTVMTRTMDTYVELSDRAAKANRYSRAVFVSIHFNATRDRSVKGFQTHYRSERGKALAASIQAAMKKSVPGISRGIDWEDYKVLRETKGTAVLVECGFISNKSEASNCGSAKHRQSLANAIASGISAMRRKL
jgi:N-acetylmuramoyl-L-alanine amidase